MGRLSGANFMRQWRAVYSASNPGPSNPASVSTAGASATSNGRETGMSIGGRRPDISFHIEICRIVCKSGKRIVWSFLVVSERWFGEDRDKTLRVTGFAKLLSGTVAAWFHEHGNA